MSGRRRLWLSRSLEQRRPKLSDYTQLLYRSAPRKHKIAILNIVPCIILGSMKQVQGSDSQGGFSNLISEFYHHKSFRPPVCCLQAGNALVAQTATGASDRSETQTCRHDFSQVLNGGVARDAHSRTVQRRNHGRGQELPVANGREVKVQNDGVVDGQAHEDTCSNSRASG